MPFFHMGNNKIVIPIPTSIPTSNRMNSNKLILPATILLGFIILGSFYYANEVNKQRSTEMQQQIAIQKNEADQAKMGQDKEQQLQQDKDCQRQGEVMTKNIGASNNDGQNGIKLSVYRIFYSQSLNECLIAYEIDSPQDLTQPKNVEKTIYYFAIRDSITYKPIFEKTFFGFDRSVFRYMSAGDFDVIINQYE